MWRHKIGSVRVGERTVSYFLLSETDSTGRWHYGVSVQCGQEQTSVYNLSTHKGSVIALLEKMQRGSVTPVAVQDVAEDWLLA